MKVAIPGGTAPSRGLIRGLNVSADSCYYNHMRLDLKKHERQWSKFTARELQAINPPNFRKALFLVGQWSDFFLKLHKKRYDRPNVRGIQRMQRLLSCLS